MDQELSCRDDYPLIFDEGIFLNLRVVYFSIINFFNFIIKNKVSDKKKRINFLLFLSFKRFIFFFETVINQY